MGYAKVATRYHDVLLEAVKPFRGQELAKREIDGLVASIFPERKDNQWIYPSDHCSNHTNKGACLACADNGAAIFKKLSERGRYLVL